jgi:hypothetical protein
VTHLCLPATVWCYACLPLYTCATGCAAGHVADVSYASAVAAAVAIQTGSYVRLELLEGVVAFHSGEAAAAATHLAAAQARWQRLQVRQQGRACLNAHSPKPLAIAPESQHCCSIARYYVAGVVELTLDL